MFHHVACLLGDIFNMHRLFCPIEDSCVTVYNLWCTFYNNKIKAWKLNELEYVHYNTE